MSCIPESREPSGVFIGSSDSVEDVGDGGERECRSSNFSIELSVFEMGWKSLCPRASSAVSLSLALKVNIA